ncbi:MAG: DUF559 domain-containing protein [Asticcacaulis sp.]|nr:DUF559 domain-containing protein [Asticcacaulis sp.]
MRPGARTELAKRFRRTLTRSEVKLWVHLKGCARYGFTVRRQHPVGPFILDFYCEKAKLAIEVDGSGHERDRQIAHDMMRDRWLMARGTEVIRFSHGDVMARGEEIAAEIINLIRSRMGLPPIS